MKLAVMSIFILCTVFLSICVKQVICKEKTVFRSLIKLNSESQKFLLILYSYNG